MKSCGRCVDKREAGAGSYVAKSCSSMCMSVLLSEGIFRDEHSSPSRPERSSTTRRRCVSWRLALRRLLSHEKIAEHGVLLDCEAFGEEVTHIVVCAHMHNTKIARCHIFANFEKADINMLRPNASGRSIGCKGRSFVVTKQRCRRKSPVGANKVGVAEDANLGK